MMMMMMMMMKKKKKKKKGSVTWGKGLIDKTTNKTVINTRRMFIQFGSMIICGRLWLYGRT